MSLPFKSEKIEMFSGGAANPSITAGTADPSAGLEAFEGSVFMRFGVGVGGFYVKSGALNTDWIHLSNGGGGGSLDASYDFGGAGAGRIINADTGAVQISATTTDTQAALYVTRNPAGSAGAVGVDLLMGSNANAASVGLQVTDAGVGTSIKTTKTNTGSAVQVNIEHVGAKALEVVVTAAPTSASPVSIVANTAGTTADLMSISKIPASSTAGNAIAVSMGANTSGAGLRIAHAGAGPAIDIAAGLIQIANNAGAVSSPNTGRLRYSTVNQTFEVSKNAGSYEGIAALATANTYTKSQNVTRVSLTDAVNIETDASLGNVFSVTLGDNRTLANPTNLVDGGVYRWIITQNIAASFTLDYGSLFKFPGNIVPVISTASGSIDMITAVYDGSILAASISQSFGLTIGGL